MSDSLYNLYSAPVNNAGIDPFQGFDFEVWINDTYTGKPAWFGKFQSFTWSIRNATESYLELGQRIPTYLDGEIQISWVLEQGLVDYAFAVRTFGLEQMRRDQFIERSPRFQISTSVNVPSLRLDAQGNKQRNAEVSNLMGADPQTVFNRTDYGTPPAFKKIGAIPEVAGRYELQRCKVDSVSMGAVAGRRVAAVRWEGVAEGWSYVNNDEGPQQFKTDRFNSGSSIGLSDLPLIATNGNNNAV